MNVFAIFNYNQGLLSRAIKELLRQYYDKASVGLFWVESYTWINTSEMCQTEEDSLSADIFIIYLH